MWFKGEGHPRPDTSGRVDSRAVPAMLVAGPQVRGRTVGMGSGRRAQNSGVNADCSGWRLLPRILEEMGDVATYLFGHWLPILRVL